ncbi:hypothetical protein G7B40_002080 [Aetokthonos hydrillicola Thurmond2011]|jgi:hypothetical protein|uniref:Uncharacterized protein n=1 Tax=Aetokthonos hydrillicola Thurmond2011 TaxID=2712845 RepID=A0AAP5M337_9CYAN|nr:hypothetical protein [Aetokthonos hydrillicola]MBO3462690.1 hypothetical protein [Aetokthonos hydrillicola CCALA 1050]MBW4588061.1 hypothetical protein [Aetokthonos hydrillicola CCALA 1050]MDR9893376.1 hypothetical protein [Aetokthonos hydrillicola Thurmond2011]
MASQQEVKQYLAYWFQLGKKVVVGNGAATMQPKQVIQGDRYSEEFEEIWQKIISNGARDCYLQGTQETIAELLTPAWEMNICCRCSLPIPVYSIGMPSELCPCNDLSNWPNTELPQPRSPINTQEQLREIHARLLQQNALTPPSS